MATKPKQYTLQEGIESWKKQLRERLIEREEDIDIFAWALLSKTHAFFLGEPGIAKSLMVDLGVASIGGLGPNDYFKLMFMKGTVPAEVFGPLDIPAFKQARYKFLTEGYLPEAKLAYGDEIWKGNSATQNSMLMITNEREFRNDGAIHKVPLWTFVATSNETPEDAAALAAIYDRFLWKKTTNRVAEPGNRIKMLELQTTDLPPVDVKITWDDIVAAHDEVRKVRVPRPVLEGINKIFHKLKDIEIFPSDRKLSHSIRAVQAVAWLKGEEEADVEHLRPLEHVYWEEPEQHPKVKSITYEMVNPLDKEIGVVKDTVNDISGELEQAIRENLDTDIRMRTGSEIYKKLKKAKAELKELALKDTGSKKRSALLGKTSKQIEQITERMLVEMLGAPVDGIDVSSMSIFDEQGNVKTEDDKDLM